MEIKRGMVFYDTNGDKWWVANTFMESELCITYRHWNKYRKRWIFYTDFKRQFMLKFTYGWKWGLKRDQKKCEEYLKKLEQ